MQGARSALAVTGYLIHMPCTLFAPCLRVTDVVINYGKDDDDDDNSDNDNDIGNDNSNDGVSGLFAADIPRLQIGL